MSDYKIEKGGIPSKKDFSVSTGNMKIESGGLPLKKEFSVALEEGAKIVSAGIPVGGKILSKDSLKKKIENADNEVVKNKVSFNK